MIWVSETTNCGQKISAQARNRWIVKLEVEYSEKCLRRMTAAAFSRIVVIHTRETVKRLFRKTKDIHYVFNSTREERFSRVRLFRLEVAE